LDEWLSRKNLILYSSQACTVVIKHCISNTIFVCFLGFGFDGVEKVNYAGGEMMYTNPAYSTAGDEGAVTFEPMPKL